MFTKFCKRNIITWATMFFCAKVQFVK